MTPFRRVFSFMTHPVVIILYVGMLVCSFFYLDRPLAITLHALQLGVQFPFLTWMTKLALGGGYLIGFFVLALFFKYCYRNALYEARSWFLWLSVLIPSVICVGLKILLGRARPDLFFRDNLYGLFGFKTHAPYWSLPSGHTTTIMSVAFALSIVFPRHGYVWMVLGFCIALTRVLLTYHYLSDVLTASYLVLLEIGLLAYYLQRKRWLLFRVE